MVVYNINEIIESLKWYSFSGLKFLSKDVILEIIKDCAHDVPYSPEVPQAIKSIEEYIKNKRTYILTKTDIAKALNVSRSTVYKWLENGIISTQNMQVLLKDLKVLEDKKGVRGQIEKIVHHISSIITNENKNRRVVIRNCKELLGIEPLIFKRLCKGEYITSKTLLSIHEELKKYYCGRS